MKKALGLALVFLLGLWTTVAAQTVNVGDNANIVPLYQNPANKDKAIPDADDYLRSNLLGQRCNEPSIGVFENNPNTMMVFCNDYRATFNWDDVTVPAGKTALARLLEGTRTFFARLLGRPKEQPWEEKGEIEASAEAGIGGGISYDGGTTWQGFMVPGGPRDESDASKLHPGKLMRLQGYADPWVVRLPSSTPGRQSDTIGVFYIGFTRDKATGVTNRSAIFFTRYRNRNASDNVHTIEYLGTSTVVDDKNMSQGQFNDKVGGAVGTDGTTIYATFSRFTGSNGSTGIYIYKSIDRGVSWIADSAIDSSSKYGQASVALASPDPDKPGVVGVLWRTFGTAPSLTYRRYAKGYKNIDLFATDVDGGPYRPFDQYPQTTGGTIDSTTRVINGGDPNRVAFRSLAFPAATYTPDGSKLLVFFTEWIDQTTGKPPVAGATNPVLPMIVMKVSPPPGDTSEPGSKWSKRYVLNQLNGEGRSVLPSPQRLGFFSPARPLGAQFMPAVACNGDNAGYTCMVIWKQDFGNLPLNKGGTENSFRPVMSGLGRRFDVRGALVTFNSSGPVVGASFQASRYGYAQPKGTGELINVSDDYTINADGSYSWTWADKMQLPNGRTYDMFSWDNRNHTGGGVLPFAGDYMSVAAIPNDPSGFFVAFADNRFNIWPWQRIDETEIPEPDLRNEWAYYPVFMAPDDPDSLIPGVSCVNYGSRVQSVMVAKVSTLPLLLTAPTNHKDFCTIADGTCKTPAPKACGPGSWQPDPNTGELIWVGSEQCIEFPVSIRNNTNTAMTVDLRLAECQDLPDPKTCAFSFAKRPYDANVDGTNTCGPDRNKSCYYDYKLTKGTVQIFPYSTYSFNVYAFSKDKITVAASVGAGTPVTLALNDSKVADASQLGEFTYTPSTVNIQSASYRGASYRGASYRGGAAQSYPVPDDPVPGQTVYNVIDYAYVVSPQSTNDAGTYLSLFNIDPAYDGNYVFQVFVTKPLTSFMTTGENPCAGFNWVDGALVGHISKAGNPLASASYRGASYRGASYRGDGARAVLPSDGDPLVQNTSFTLGSSLDPATATGSLSATSVSASTSTSTSSDCPNGTRIDLCTKAAPRFRNEVTILVRAYQVQPTSSIPADRVYDPYGLTGPATRPSVAVAEYSCANSSCTSALGPDLAVTVSAPPVTTTRVPAGGTITFDPTISITNRGVDGECGTPATPGQFPYDDPCGEAHEHKWAVYASTVANFADLPKYDCQSESCPAGAISGTVKLNDDPKLGFVTVLLDRQPDGDWTGEHGKLACGSTKSNPNCNGPSEEWDGVGTVTIPASIPRLNKDGTGTYYLHFLDDSRRIVNELNEENNTWSSVAITVEAPGYGFLGLQTPCTGMTCSKTGTLPLAWQFTRGSMPVDSVSTLPRLRFYDSCPPPLGLDGYPSGPVKASSVPNAADLTSGASGWQYFPNVGMTRPQYTWQFNFDATGLPRGVCYSMYIEVPDTGQEIGSTKPELKPFGPFYIAPR